MEKETTNKKSSKAPKQVTGPIKCGEFTIYPVKVSHAVAEEIAFEKPFIKDAGTTMKLVARFFVLSHPSDKAVQAARDMTPEHLLPFIAQDVYVMSEFCAHYDAMTSAAKAK